MKTIALNALALAAGMFCGMAMLALTHRPTRIILWYWIHAHTGIWVV